MDAVMRKWRWTLVVVGMFCFGSVWGQFGKERVIAECSLICEPGTPLFADFDKDGDVDIVFAGYNNQIVWHENLASGTYRKRIIATLKFDNEFTRVVDLDKDSDSDIVTAGEDGKIYWYRNNGKGEFVQQLIANTRHPSITEFYNSIDGVEIADYDIDGDLDILIHLSSNNLLTWYTNRGNATFIEGETIDDSEPFLSGSVLNIDDDKELEITFFNFSRNQIGYFDKVGQIFEKRIITTAPLGLWLQSIFYKDLDGDNKVDVVFSASHNYQYHPATRIGYLKNQGKNIFSPPVVLIENDDLHHVIIEDLNQDGVNDIAGIGIFGNQVNIFTRNTQNTFSFNKSISIDIDIVEFFGVYDLNNDGLKDLIISSDAYSYLGFYYSQKNWDYSHQIISKSQLNGLVAAFSLDLNGDKYNDLLVGTAELDPAKFIKYANNGKQNILRDQIIQFPDLSLNDFLPVDMDNDGIVEILFAGYGSTTLGWFEQNTKDSSPMIQTIDSGTESLANLCVSDLDNDGNEDIVVSVANSEKLMWFKKKANGHFSEKMTILNNLGEIRSIQAADVDYDGIKDLIVHVPKRLFWLKSSVQGFFYSPTTIRRFVDVYNLAYQVMDLDKDGDQDLIIEHTEGSRGVRLEWLVNNGKGDFSETKVICDYDVQLPYLSIKFSIGDVDKDGDADVVFSDQGNVDKRLFWVENQGQEIFAQPIFIAPLLRRIENIQLTDLDGDADLDILLAYDDDILSWFENRISNPNISGVAFWDKNANGKFDPNESIIKNLPIQLTPSATSTFTGSDGKYRFYVPDGRYQISVQPDECWQLTTDSLSYTVNIAGNVALNRNFGFQLVPKAQAVQPRLSSGPTRCGFDVSFVLSVQNEGCVPSKGMFGLVRSPFAKYLGASVFPDRVKGDTLLWNYSTLVGTAAQQLRLNFQIAGTDFLGDTIHIKTLAYLENPQGQLKLAGTYDYRSEIRCAYDPNDKLTFPNRRSAYPRNYTLFKEEMEFLVRFQNTGNDTAFTVVIRDTLDKNLDWSTFRPLVGSHPFETHIQEKGALSFTFKNILLPDSKTNEPLSHGFVSYRVSPKRGLPEQTEINNTAYIYFDFNPSIQTNTTSNVMVSSLPRATRTKDINSRLDHKLYPNPFDDELLLEIAGVLDGRDYTFSLFNSQSQVIRHKKVTSAIERIDTGQLPSGLYFYLIKDTHGSVVASGKVVCR